MDDEDASQSLSRHDENVTAKKEATDGLKIEKLDLPCYGDVTLPPKKRIGADHLISCVKECKPTDVTNDHGEVNDEKEKDATMLVPKSSIDDMLTEGNLNYYNLLGCTVSLTVTMIKAVNMYRKLPDGLSQMFDCDSENEL